MPGLLPIICYILILTALVKCLKSTFDLRGYILFASLIWGALVVLGTEWLSLSSNISFRALVTFWSVACLIPLSFILPRPGSQPMQPLWNAPALTRPQQSLIGLISFYICLIGIIAVVAPPNNYDSLTYHMGRIAHWVHNHNVAHFATHIPRQLYQGPWAEFAILHFQILLSSDHFANLIQWYSMSGCLIGASLITKELKGNIQTQIIASVLVITLPMGILQGSSTQTDYVAAFWMTCFVYFLLVWQKNLRWIDTLAVGTSLALGWLTKPTLHLYSIPFLILLVFPNLKKQPRTLAKQIPVIFLIVLLINGSHYLRNIQTFHHPLSDPLLMADKVNHSLSLSLLTSNIIRNIAIQFWTFSQTINTLIENIVQWLHVIINADITGLQSTYNRFDFKLYGSPLHEDYAPNFAHTILILFSLLIFLCSRRLKNKPLLGTYALSVITAFLLFNISLKWTPWNSRLQLPLFIIWSPFVAVILNACLTKYRTATKSVIIMIIIMSLPWLFYNANRSILGNKNIFSVPRLSQYFANDPEAEPSYVGAIEILNQRGCSKIGLYITYNTWEYPLWVLGHHKFGKELEIKHVNVTNASSRLLDPDFNPCAVIGDYQSEKEERLTVNGENYTKLRTLKKLIIFIKKNIY